MSQPGFVSSRSWALRTIQLWDKLDILFCAGCYLGLAGEVPYLALMSVLRLYVPGVIDAIYRPRSGLLIE